MPCNSKFRFAAVLLVLILAGQCLAWGVEGHQLIAMIAEARLTPETRGKIHELLGDVVNMYDAEVVDWADRMKRDWVFSEGYHYVNVPFDAAGYDQKRDDPTHAHIVYAIEKFTAILADKQQPKEQREQALRFVIHLIGDLHQPLHTIQRNGDKGGNGRPVKYPGKAKPLISRNLHAVWDKSLPLEYFNAADLRPDADALNNEISDDDADKWRAGSIID